MVIIHDYSRLLHSRLCDSQLQRYHVCFEFGAAISDPRDNQRVAKMCIAHMHDGHARPDQLYFVIFTITAALDLQDRSRNKNRSVPISITIQNSVFVNRQSRSILVIAPCPFTISLAMMRAAQIPRHRRLLIHATIMQRWITRNTKGIVSSRHAAVANKTGDIIAIRSSV